MMQNWLRRFPGGLRIKRRQGRRYRPVLEGLEHRVVPTVVIDPRTLTDKMVPAGKSVIVPIVANDTDGNPITFTFQSDNPQVTVQQHTGNTFLKLSVQNFGDMTFQLFNDLTPITVGKITGLVNQGFYNGLTFHRVVPNFVIQGGDPRGDGSGGPADRGITGFPFINEFISSLIFSGSGQLAMANAGRDANGNATNGSQFFVTFGAQRSLDFNHTIFGQLVRGFDVAQNIDNVPRDARDKPNTPVVITSATIVPDTSDTVITVNVAQGFTGFGKITITASNGRGGTDNQVLTVQGFADTTNDPAIIGPVANQTTNKNTPVTFNLTGLEIENEQMDFAVDALDSPPHVTIQVNGSQVTATPDTGFVGTIRLVAKVKERGATSRGSATDPFDAVPFTLTVNDTGPPPPPPPGGGTTAAFVAQSYRSSLGREPDGNGAAFFQSMIDQGRATRPQVALTIATSLESRTKQVQDFYQKFLGRAADPVGLTNSILWLGSGHAMMDLRKTIVSSPEYFQGHGRGSNQEFAKALYQDGLGRPIDPVGTGGAAPALDNGMSRAQLADQVFRSPEGLQAIIQGFYNQILHRTVDDSGLTTYRTALSRGTSEEVVYSAIASSDEASAGTGK